MVLLLQKQFIITFLQKLQNKKRNKQCSKIKNQRKKHIAAHGRKDHRSPVPVQIKIVGKAEGGRHQPQKMPVSVLPGLLRQRPYLPLHHVIHERISDCINKKQYQTGKKRIPACKMNRQPGHNPVNHNRLEASVI